MPRPPIDLHRKVRDILSHVDPLPAEAGIAPTRDDIRHLKRFLDEMAEHCNWRIGERRAELLTAIHATDPSLFVPKEVADVVTGTFGFVLTLAGVAGTLPP